MVREVLDCAGSAALFPLCGCNLIAPILTACPPLDPKAARQRTHSKTLARLPSAANNSAPCFVLENG
jgi:hypothetical protein